MWYLNKHGVTADGTAFDVNKLNGIESITL